ncbi:hypothetical protein GUJ93_ZPchr0007g5558 [Zizania palustris]|uniref:Secreted protein n=1 Tax=Zizania palustris TaxID=103762 RepID=A0A8J5TE08_ZIZPA|nr:hypothetical protein GUJ93_ZPchr0007g5558 [Zizania palustris]
MAAARSPPLSASVFSFVLALLFSGQPKLLPRTVVLAAVSAFSLSSGGGAACRTTPLATSAASSHSASTLLPLVVVRLELECSTWCKLLSTQVAVMACNHYL